MKFSKEISKLVPALAKAQEMAKTPRKNKEAHHYNYADLAEVMECIKPAMKETGLMCIQATGHTDSQKFGLFTRVIHIESGEWLEAFYELDSDLDPQDQGKENTYFRRYSLNNIFTLVAESEDTDAAGVKKKPKVAAVNSFSRGNSL